jgi:glycerophosphoryl diester phosphodiesterase
MTHYPIVIAHQGASTERPPNTLAAFRRAAALGADIIELDVTCTLDGTVVVSHDLNAEVRTNGRGCIPELTLEEVKCLDTGVRFNELYTGERIPTLEETISWVRNETIHLCIEIKGEQIEHYIRAGRATVELLRRLDYLQPVTLTSFNPACIHAMKAWEPRLAWGLDPDENRRYSGWELCQQVLSCGASFLLHRHDTLTTEIVREAHHHGFSVWVWTIDEPAAMRQAAEIGVDAIMSNRPDLLRATLEGKE